MYVTDFNFSTAYCVCAVRLFLMLQLWLFQFHNGVSRRILDEQATAAIGTGRGDSNDLDTSHFYSAVMWPSESQCKGCFTAVKNDKDINGGGSIRHRMHAGPVREALRRWYWDGAEWGTNSASGGGSGSSGLAWWGSLFGQRLLQGNINTAAGISLGLHSDVDRMDSAKKTASTDAWADKGGDPRARSSQKKHRVNGGDSEADATDGSVTRDGNTGDAESSVVNKRSRWSAHSLRRRQQQRPRWHHSYAQPQQGPQRRGTLLYILRGVVFIVVSVVGCAILVVYLVQDNLRLRRMAYGIFRGGKQRRL